MDTRFGVHHPSDYYWNPPNLIQFCEDLKRHGVSWYTLWANDLHQVELAKALIDHNIEVIYRPGQNLIPSQFIGGIYEQYRHARVKYCQFFNEPNLRGEWKNPKDMNPERFAEIWASRCQALKCLGFIPVVPPLSPGGDHWHPDFFHRMMNWWKREGLLPDLLRGCVLGIHNRPTLNPPDDPGVCAFDGYKHYRQWMLDIMGFSLDMVAPEAGYQPEDMNHDWEKWKNWNLELIRRFRPGHPKYVGDDFLAHCFWIYHDTGSIWDRCGLVENWYYAQDHGGDRVTNLWRALEHEDWDEIPDPEPEPEPIPEPEPMDIEFVGLSEEMIERLTLNGPEDPEQPYWKIVKIEVQPHTNNQSAYAIFTDYMEYAEFFWGSGQHEDLGKADPLAPEGARQWAASMPMFAPWGSYGVRLGGNSESLSGFGLYGEDLDMGRTTHRPVLVYFKQVQPDEPKPEPEPPPAAYTLKRRLEQAPYGFEDLRFETESLSDMPTVKQQSLDAGRIDDGGNPQFGNLRHIVLHHLGGTYYGALELAEWEIQNNKEIDHATCPYHFIIEKDGAIKWMVAIKYYTRHAAGANQHGIGIAFEDDAAEAQMEAGRFLIASLYEFFGAKGWGSFRLTGLFPHSQLGYVNDQGQLWHTSCPGKVWPKILWSGEWPKLMEGEWPDG